VAVAAAAADAADGVGSACAHPPSTRVVRFGSIHPLIAKLEEAVRKEVAAHSTHLDSVE
jgi:hypothetical protein